MDFEFSFDKEGNSDADLSELCTTCPLFVGELLNRKHQGPLRCYRKFLPNRRRGRPCFGDSNYGDVVSMVQRWFAFQGICSIEEPFSSNSGRRSLALWLSEVECPYRESFHVMGDLECVWRESYQPDLPPSGGYKMRIQSEDHLIARDHIMNFC